MVLLFSVHKIVIFPANWNWNRLAEPTSVQIGIGIICEFQRLKIGIVRQEVFANYSQIPEENKLSLFFSLFLVLDSYIIY